MKTLLKYFEITLYAPHLTQYKFKNEHSDFSYIRIYITTGKSSSLAEPKMNQWLILSGLKNYTRRELNSITEDEPALAETGYRNTRTSFRAAQK